ncbi:MAG: KpsF/GutQ family sugar-phosphate isomerase [Elusimicrobiota bacterium]|nr:KpsF/GutQ family sugar-phosphate isomerase [Elusimicrobiota bacterium]
MNTLQYIKQILEIESEAVREQIKHINLSFLKAIEMIKAVTDIDGRILVTRIGKSGIIGRKISATFSSLGLPSNFVHLSELAHGDLGTVTSNDLIIVLSYSGESEELKNILPALKKMNIKLIALTGRKKSFLAKFADCILDVSVKKEACQYDLVPTASTTAMLAVGDAIALTVAKLRGFKKEDFALFHPAGTLGKKLLLKVGEIMRTGKENPVISQNSTVRKALIVMTKTRLGAVSVVDNRGHLVGYFTDGDLRRKLQKDNLLLDRKLKDVMTKNPKSITADKIAYESAQMLKKFNCDNLPVVDKYFRPIGIIDERDLIAVGIM